MSEDRPSMAARATLGDISPGGEWQVTTVFHTGEVQWTRRPTKVSDPLPPEPPPMVLRRPLRLRLREFLCR